MFFLLTLGQPPAIEGAPQVRLALAPAHQQLEGPDSTKWHWVPPVAALSLSMPQWPPGGDWAAHAPLLGHPGHWRIRGASQGTSQIAPARNLIIVIHTQQRRPYPLS